MRFRSYTQRRATVGRTSLDRGPAPHRDLYLTTHNTHNIQTSMPPEGFEPTIPAGERPHSYALNRAATGTGAVLNKSRQIHFFSYRHIICNSLKKLLSVTRPSFSTNVISAALKSGFKNFKNVEQLNCAETTCSFLKSKLQAYTKSQR